MNIAYQDLIEQTYEWPVFAFNQMPQGNLTFHGIPLAKAVREFGTPLKLTYLPIIGQRIEDARHLFKNAMQKTDYKGTYTYCYCTKSSHFAFVLKEVLEHDAQLETSSAYDMDIIQHLSRFGYLPKDTYIICNGFKRNLYLDKISEFIRAGFQNVLPILDNKEELQEFENRVNQPFQVGIRVATEEEPKFEFYTSRLGIRYQDILPFYQEQISQNPQVSLKMLHFFINTGINDNAYYWSELSKAVTLYCDLKALCPELDSLDIGGGFPFPQSLGFEYDYQYMTEEVLKNIKDICESRGVPTPHIFTEFGSYTVAESSANLFTVIGQKQQNDSELWYMIDNSFITSLPDTWGTGERFILLPVNHWDKPYQRVNLGGLTCDSMDYYNSEVHQRQVFMPQFPSEEPLILGFFNTGAYQDALSGYGGIKHCLIPGIQHVLVDHDEAGNLVYQRFSGEQPASAMMQILGYE